MSNNGGSSPTVPTDTSGNNQSNNGNSSNSNSSGSSSPTNLSLSSVVHDLSSGSVVHDLSCVSVPGSPTNESIYNLSVSDVSFSFVSITQLPSLDQCDVPPAPVIVSDLSSTTINGVGYNIVNSKGTASDGSSITNVKFDTTNPELYAPQIQENLTEVVSMYNDETDLSGQTVTLLNQIKSYASQIQCSDFHEKGSIEDYTVLFQAASKIATESKHMDLNIDIAGFNEFADAADELSELFNGFITKLQNVNIITDVSFLQSISIALGKIVNLSNIFGRFKATVLATSTIQIPKSSHDATLVIKGVMAEVNCAMQYINYFVSPESNPNLVDAQLTSAERNIITQSVNTINSWNILCDQGVSIAMSTDPNIQYIQQASNQLKTTTVNLKNVTASLKSKLASFSIPC
jgi:hypothetical protein